MADAHEDYDPECRFANWKCEYRNLLKNLKAIDIDSIQVKGTKSGSVYAVEYFTIQNVIHLPILSIYFYRIR